MDDTEKHALIERYWESSSTGQDLTDEIYHEDAVLEFPQSGERFEGTANFREWRSVYPASVRLELRELRGAGDLWVAEGSITYDDGPGPTRAERPGLPRRQGGPGDDLRD
jgi:hypothetical protein